MFRVLGVVLLSLFCFFLPQSIYLSDSSDIQRLLSDSYLDSFVSEIGWLCLVKLLYIIGSVVNVSVIHIWSTFSFLSSFLILNKFSKYLHSFSSFIFFLLFFVAVLLPAATINLRLLPVLLCISFIPSLFIATLVSCFFHLSASFIFLPFLIGYLIHSIMIICKNYRVASLKTLSFLFFLAITSSFAIPYLFYRFIMYYTLFQSSAGIGLSSPLLLLFSTGFMFFLVSNLRHEMLVFKMPLLTSLLSICLFSMFLLCFGNHTFLTRLIQICILILYGFMFSPGFLHSSVAYGLSISRKNLYRINLRLFLFNSMGILSFIISAYLYLARIGIAV